MDHCDATGILPTQTSSSILPPYSTQTRGHSNVDFETTGQQHPTVKEVKNHIANDINNPITTTPALDTPRRSVSIRIPEEADYDGKVCSVCCVGVSKLFFVCTVQMLNNNINIHSH